MFVNTNKAKLLIFSFFLAIGLFGLFNQADASCNWGGSPGTDTRVCCDPPNQNTCILETEGHTYSGCQTSCWATSCVYPWVVTRCVGNGGLLCPEGVKGGVYILKCKVPGGDCVSSGCVPNLYSGCTCYGYTTHIGTCEGAGYSTTDTNIPDCGSGGGLPNGSSCTAGSECSGGYCCDNVCGSASCSPACIPQGTNCLGQESNCCSGLSCQSPWWQCQCTPCPDPSTYCPGQTVQDGCGYDCPAIPGTKICDSGPPTNFGHSGNTINAITWIWTKPVIGGGYYGTPTKYQLFDSLGNLLADNIPTTVCSGSNCSWQETSLLTNVQYARFVKACNQSVCSIPSNTANAYTSIQTVVSAQCTSINTNSIQVTAYSAGGLGFSNLSLGSSGVLFSGVGLRQSNTYNYTGLSPSTPYTFTIGPSINGDGEGYADPSVSLSCDTQAVSPIPDAPANLHHTANTVNTIDWAWDASTGATYYKIYIFDDSWNWRWKIDITAITYHQTDSYFQSTGWTVLSSNTMYRLAVSACNASGCSGMSMADGATSISAPTDITCSNITQNSMRVQAAGSFPNLAFGSSRIIFREAGGATQDSQSAIWNLLGLIPETNYSFFAKARNQEGDLTTEFGPKACSTLSPTIFLSLRTYGPGSSILKLALISIEDALLLNRGTIKTLTMWQGNGTYFAAYLVPTTDPNASPVRVMTPMGIKAWRLGP